MTKKKKTTVKNEKPNSKSDKKLEKRLCDFEYFLELQRREIRQAQDWQHFASSALFWWSLIVLAASIAVATS